MFKFICVVTGYFISGWWGAFFGLLLGVVIDRVRAFGQGALNPLQHAVRQAVFLETVFIAMGKLAKADGRVSEEEIAHAEEFMQKLGMTAEHRQLAISWFRKGSDPAFDIEPVLLNFNAVCGHTRNLKEVLLVYLIVMALADGHFHPAEEALLTDMAGRLGYGPAAFRHLMDMVLNQSRFAGRQEVSGVALGDAYKALGVSVQSSDAEIKRAYRKLMSQYHPDKLMGQGMPEDMIKVATEQAKEIQVAYDLIRKSRNL